MFLRASIILLISVAASAGSPRFYNIFGVDDRVQPTRDNPVSRKVFRLEFVKTDGTHVCSGFLISEEWGMTNSHCVGAAVEREHLRGKERIPFDRITDRIVAKFDYSKGMCSEEVEVVEVVRDKAGPEDGTPSDWALLRFKGTPGQTRGYFGFFRNVEPESDENGTDLVLAAYSGDLAEEKGLTMVTGCAFRGFDSGYGLNRHDCDVTRGSSGAPLLKCDNHGVCRVVGINVRENRDGEGSMTLPEYSKERANFAIPVAGVVPEIEKVVLNAVFVDGKTPPKAPVPGPSPGALAPMPQMPVITPLVPESREPLPEDWSDEWGTPKKEGE